MQSRPELNSITSCPFHNVGKQVKILKEGKVESLDQGGKLERVAAEVMVLERTWPQVWAWVASNPPGLAKPVITNYTDLEIDDLTPEEPTILRIQQENCTNHIEQEKMIVAGVTTTIRAITIVGLRELENSDNPISIVIGELRKIFVSKKELEPNQVDDLDLMLMSGINTAVYLCWGLISAVMEKLGTNATIDQIITTIRGSYSLLVNLASLHIVGLDSWIEKAVSVDGKIHTLKGEYFLIKNDALVFDEQAANLPQDLATTTPRTRCPALYVPNLIRELLEWQIEIARNYYIPARLKRDKKTQLQAV